MDLQFRLFVREQPDGMVVATALADLDISHSAPTRRAALRAVRRELTRTVMRRGPFDQPPHNYLAYNEQQELRLIDVALVPTPRLQDEPLTLTVSLVITPMPRRRGVQYLVIAPRLAGLVVLVNDPERIDAQARIAIARLAEDWDAQTILAADQIGVESLETITVNVPDPSPNDDDDDDDDTSDNDLGDIFASGPPGSGRRTPSWLRGNREAASDDDAADSVLQTCGINLSVQATNGRLSRTERRDALVERVLGMLQAPTMNSVVLVGEPGVGKTALVHEVVGRIMENRVPGALADRAMWFVTANNLIAGMSVIGEWQERVVKLLQEVKTGRQILYMTDPGELIEVGRTRGSDNNIGRFLRPYLASGELTAIFEATPGGYEAALAADPSFMHTLHRIDVPPSDEGDSRAILQATAQRLEATRNVRIDAEGIGTAYELARRFMPYRAFPGKAVGVLHDTVQDALPDTERSAETLLLGRAEVVASFTRSTGLPTVLLSDTAVLDPVAVRTFFEERLVGQPEVVQLLGELVMVLKAGLHDPERPLGSYFFVGPTGVGKTEAAKVLAAWLFGSRERLVRFDMSEYSGEDALPRLIGTAWRDEGTGELTRRVREQPFCVVLFDEIEKAHPKVFDTLLQVLGEGRLTDAKGNTVDFRNSVIIMTSNLGAQRKSREHTGFSTSVSRDSQSDDRLLAHYIKEAEDYFKPEFYNRIGRIVAFRPLTLDAIRRLALRELGKLLMREGIVRRNLLVEIDDAVVETLVTQGFHPLYGARPLQRAIERLLIVPLAQAVVSHADSRGNLLCFELRDDAIHLDFVPVDNGMLAEDKEPPLTSAQRRAETDVTTLIANVRALRETLAVEERGLLVQRLRGEVGVLLQRTHAPNFWDDPDAARDMLARVYALDRVLQRLQTLAEQAEATEERGKQMRAHRDRRGVPALAHTVERLGADWDYLEMELAGAAAPERHDQALLRITPIGRGSEAWAGRVLGMYAAWAGRKSYEATRYEPPPPDADYAVAPSAALYVEGTNVYALLRGERGLHTLHSGVGDERTRRIVRVAVLPVPPLPTEPTQFEAAVQGAMLGSAGDDGRGDGSNARVYHEGKQRFVKDGRTGTRVTDPRAVVDDGQIDAFLLAYLRQAVEVVG